MDSTRNKLKEMLTKCQQENIDLLQIKSVRKFLKDNKKSTGRKEKWLTFLLISCILTYGVNYYYSELQSKVKQLLPI